MRGRGKGGARVREVEGRRGKVFWGKLSWRIEERREEEGSGERMRERDWFCSNGNGVEVRKRQRKRGRERER